MGGVYDPDDPEELGRQERDTEPIPRTRGEGPEPSEDDSHFVGRAHVGASSGSTSNRPLFGPPPRAPQGRPEVEITAEEIAGLGGGGDGPGISNARRVLPLEAEPSPLVARYLFPTERYRGEWRKHWIHLTNHILIGAAATLVLGYLTGFLAKNTVPGLSIIAVVIYAGVMGWVAWSVADWYFDRFILTNKRVMVVKGLITRDVAMMPLGRVTDMKYQQSPIGRMLNYGTFVIESAGQDQALREVKHLPNPNELYLRVVEEMYEPAAVEARLGKDDDGDS